MQTVAPATELDVREIVPRERHQLIFRLLDGLAPGQTLLLINDHDPIPLYYQLEATRPDQYSWDYLEQGPEVWRVNIARKPAAAIELAGQTIAAIVEQHPETMPIFTQFGLDLCCGGGLTIDQAATAHGLMPQTVLSAVRAQLNRK
jgi:regulator of cell morphogenesis and NO signaling